MDANDPNPVDKVNQALKSSFSTRILHYVIIEMLSDIPITIRDCLISDPWVEVMRNAPDEEVVEAYSLSMSHGRISRNDPWEDIVWWTEVEEETRPWPLTPSTRQTKH